MSILPPPSATDTIAELGRRASPAGAEEAAVRVEVCSRSSQP